MYDRAEVAGVYDRLWGSIQQDAQSQGLMLPDHLTRDVDEDALWSNPKLILGQICNLPFRQTYHETLHIIGAMDYGVRDVPAGFYDSVIITRPEHKHTPISDLRFAYNSTGSNSGWDAPHIWADRRAETLSPALETGGHIASLLAVAKGEADIAALDSVTFRQCLKWDDAAQDVIVLDRTGATPGMLLVTRDRHIADTLFTSVNVGLAQLSQTDRNTLGLNKIVPIDANSVINLPKSRMTD